MDYRTITSYEAACADQGRDPNDRPDFSKAKMSPTQEQYHKSAFEFDVIAKSINKDKHGNEWKPTPDDARWTVWVDIIEDSSKRSGFGLSFDVFGYVDSGTFVASRLTFRDQARAKFMFDTFPELYEDLLIPQF